MAAPKKYGLLLPKSKQGPVKQKATSSNVFGEDSDDDEHSKTNIEEMIKKESKRNLNRLDTQMTMKKALEEDANVFEYDEVYDDMKAKKEEQDISNKVITKDRKAKYIDEMLKNAAARKREEERRQQRKIQKEREEEKEEFGDKEAFVTSAYKKKMEEMKLEEEEAKRREQLEEMMDVTKQRDLSGFYRHLLKQQCGEEKIPDQVQSAAPVDKKEPGPPKQKAAPSSSKDKAQDPDADTDIEMSSDEEVAPKSKRKATTRTYRKRKQQSDSEDEPTNADADESIEESSSESDDGESGSKKVEGSAQSKSDEKDEPEQKPEPRRTPRDWKEMFEKRCVGEKFESARERYLQRRETRRGVAVQ